MNNRLMTLKNIPVTTSTIISLYPEIVDKHQKVAVLEKKNEIIRLKRGLYVVNPKLSGMMVSTGLIANHLHTPSYVSMETALRYYGLIPEAVYLTRSMTLKRAKTFENQYGRFEYISSARNSYPIGITREKSEGVYFLIASPEKALCDLVAETTGINLRYIKEAEEYLEKYLRFDMEALTRFNLSILKEYAKVGKKGNSIQTIINLIEQ